MLTTAKEKAVRPDLGITLNHAASVLRSEVGVIDSLVRREKIVPTQGTTGRGGQYRLDRASLVTLATALRLAALHVPRPAIKRLMALLRPQLDIEGELAVVYAPEKEMVVRIDGEGTTLRELIGAGATVEVLAPRARRAELERRLLVEDAPRHRGRPKFDAEWARRKLDESAGLGDDDTPPEELSRMIGDRGKPPWRRGR